MGSQSSVPWDPDDVFWLSQKMTQSVYVCSPYQNFVLLVDAMDWEWTYKDMTKKIVCNTERSKCIIHRCESCPGTATRNNFLIRNSTNMKMMRNLITVSGTLRIEQYWQPLQPLTKNTKRLIDVIDDLTRHSYIAKLKITSSWYRTKSKATTGVKNTASYIPWLYTTWDQMVASNMIHCVLVLMTTTITQAFCIKFKPWLFIILKLIIRI